MLRGSGRSPGLWVKRVLKYLRNIYLTCNPTKRKHSKRIK